MQILVRDAARPYHPVIGIAALASPIIQIAERDQWIGWDTDSLVRHWSDDASPRAANWLLLRNRQLIAEIYVDDLLRESVLREGERTRPSLATIERLRSDAERHRRRHHSQVAARHMRPEPVRDWVKRAETPLFRSKRSLTLAACLEAELVLAPMFGQRGSATRLRKALEDPAGMKQIRGILRRARGERVGTLLADLSVCGALPPYNGLVAGKLVAALAVSPRVIAAYTHRYNRPSEIASSMAGRPIIRDARLAFVGTTSL